MASNAPIEVPDWRVIHQGLTVEHGCWEPSLGFWGLNISPFCSSVGSVADFLLLCNSLSLFFAGWTKSSSFHHIFALLLSPPLRVHLFNPRGNGWLRSTERKLRWGRWNFGLNRLPRSPFACWFSINSIRLFWGFLWIPISSGRLLGDEGWSNTSKLSTDSVKSTKPRSSCSSSPSWRVGEGDGAPTERVAIGKGSGNTVFLGSGMPSRTTNPS